MGNSFTLTPVTSGGDLITNAMALEYMGDPTLTAAQTAQLTKAVSSAIGEIRRHLCYDPVLSYQTEYYPRVDLNQNPGGRGFWEVNDTHAYLRSYDGRGSNQLQLARIPVREDSTAGSQTMVLYRDYDGRNGTKSGGFSDQLVQGTDWWPNYDTVDSNGKKICKDGILNSHGIWPSEPGSIKVSYLAGYTESELAGTDDILDASPIREVAITEAIRRFVRMETIFNKRAAGFNGPFTSENLGDYSYSVDSAILSSLVGFKGNGLMLESSLRLESFRNFGAMIAS